METMSGELKFPKGSPVVTGLVAAGWSIVRESETETIVAFTSEKTPYGWHSTDLPSIK